MCSCDITDSPFLEKYDIIQEAVKIQQGIEMW